MLEDEELKAQIDQLRERRRERKQEQLNQFDFYEEKEEENSKDDGVLGVLTTQGIITVIIAIIYVIGLSFFNPQINSVTHEFKDLLNNDFSFKDKVYSTVSEIVTYLNTIAPIEQEKQEGQGGEFLALENNIKPKNVTFAPIIYTGSITYPLEKGKVTSGFEFRTNPLVNKPEFHNALDIAAPEGTPIKAAASGVIIKSETDKSLGNYIVIDHSNGFTTTYAHCSKLIAKEGMRIREGEIIAKVGSTGASTGPHVHFATKKDGLYFNPNYLFNQTYWLLGD